MCLFNTILKIFLCPSIWLCPRRLLDASRLEHYFLLNGCKIVSKPEDADYIIYIPCGFINPSFNQSLKTIKRLKKYKGELIVGGCVWDIDGNRIKKVFDGKYFTTRNINKIEEYFPEFRYKFEEIPDSNEFYYKNFLDLARKEIISNLGAKSTLKDYITSVKKKLLGRLKKVIKDFLKIFNIQRDVFRIRVSWGCNENCTYCSHRKAIGPHRSKKLDECISEFLKGYEKGYRTFEITAMNTGAYGLDIGTTLPHLIEHLLRLRNNVKFILDELNPVWLVKYKKEIYKLCKQGKIKKINSPVQSGNYRVLKLMNRYSNLPELIQTFKTIKKVCPIINTQIIAGFPSETEEEFENSLKFIKDVGFVFVQVWPYYENENIPSYQILPKCSRESINKRITKAINFFDKNKIHYEAHLDLDSAC